MNFFVPRSVSEDLDLVSLLEKQPRIGSDGRVPGAKALWWSKLGIVPGPIGGCPRCLRDHVKTGECPEFSDALAEELVPYERAIIESVVARPFRAAAFSVAIKDAYENTCAMTGLKIINGGGRAEVQAAHIQPVSQKGPDSIRNGLALSGTVHWMFDRGLVSVDDDFPILIAKDRLPDTALKLLNENHRLIRPHRADLRPHRHYLGYHRENIFKG